MQARGKKCAGSLPPWSRAALLLLSLNLNRDVVGNQHHERTSECSAHFALYSQIYDDLLPWRDGGITAELMNASFAEAYNKHESNMFTTVQIMILDGKVYLTRGAMPKDMNDFIFGMLHDLQDTVNELRDIPDLEFVMHTSDHCRSSALNVFTPRHAAAPPPPAFGRPARTLPLREARPLPVSCSKQSSFVPPDTHACTTPAHKAGHGSAVNRGISKRRNAKRRLMDRYRRTCASEERIVNRFQMFGYCKRDGDFEILVPSGHFWQHQYDTMLHADWQNQHASVPWDAKKSTAFGRFTAANLPNTNRDFLGRTLSSNPREALTNLSRMVSQVNLLKGQLPVLDVQTFNDFRTNARIPGVNPVPIEQFSGYKYLVSLDGYSCSTRFEKLLALNSVVLKQKSRFISYYYGAIKPYVHYMPFWESSQYDVYDAVHWLETHQDLAMKMARRGRIFAQGHLNKRARMCYWRTLLVEYAELMKFSPSLDRYPNAILLDNDPLMQKQPKTLMGNNIWHIGADAHRRSALRRSSRLS